MVGNTASFHGGVHSSTSQTLPGVPPQQGQKPQTHTGIPPEYHQRVVSSGIAPASEASFTQLLGSYMKQAGVAVDEQFLTIDGRRIDSYKLHSLVLGSGGYIYVRFCVSYFRFTS